jgi:hypothetical protein
MSAVSLLGGLSAVRILSGQDTTITGYVDITSLTNYEATKDNQNNIVFPYINPLFNLDVSSNIGSSVNFTDWYLQIPFKIRNAGYFDLSNFVLGTIITLKNATGTNDEEIINVNAFRYPTIPAQSPGISYYILDNFQYSGNLSEWSQPPELFVDVYFSASYSLDLIDFEVWLFQIPIGSLI